MNLHGPTCLDGPVSQSRSRWQSPADKFSAVESRLQAGPSAIRTELVARVRREIAAGCYDTDDKLELALAKLFQNLDLD